MINKLRRKIFWIIQIPFSIIILGVIIIFSTLNYRNIITSSTMFMDRLDGGRKEIRNEAPEYIDNLGMNDNQFVINIEGVYKIELNNDSIVRESNDVTDEIRNYAVEVSNKNREEGYVGKYVYKIRRVGNNGKEITLMENEESIARLKRMIWSAVIIGLLGLFIIYIIAKKVAKFIVEPVDIAFEKQKQFVSDASHELKTPLAVIEANCDVLQDKVGENKWLMYIQSEVKSMDKLVNDLLTLAKVENTKSINKQRFDLSKEVQMAVAVFESMIYEKSINLETNIDEGVFFNGDKEDIKHIVSIILDNAIKHTDSGNKIVVNVNKDKCNVKIEIKNQGAPIPTEDQEKIFERFYRVDKARNRNEKRYGLGLAIAKAMVNKYNGTISAFSNNGYTTFTVKFDV